jgi:hypothetical protein
MNRPSPLAIAPSESTQRRSAAAARPLCVMVLDVSAVKRRAAAGNRTHKPDDLRAAHRH